jgi:hypothetical protein
MPYREQEKKHSEGTFDTTGSPQDLCIFLQLSCYKEYIYIFFLDSTVKVSSTSGFIKDQLVFYKKELDFFIIAAGIFNSINHCKFFSCIMRLSTNS